MESVARLNEVSSTNNQNIVDFVVKIIKEEKGVYLPIGLDEPEMKLFSATVLDMKYSSTSAVFIADCSFQVEQEVVHIFVGCSRFEEPGVKHHIRSNHLNILCIDVSSIAAKNLGCTSDIQNLLRSTGVRWLNVNMTGIFGTLFFQHQKSLILAQRESYRQGVVHVKKMKLAKQQFAEQLAQLNESVSAQQRLLNSRVEQENTLRLLLVELQQLQSEVDALKQQKHHLAKDIQEQTSFINILHERESRVASLEKSLVLAKTRYLAASKHLNIITPLLRELGRKYGQPWPIDDDTVSILKEAGESCLIETVNEVTQS